MHDHFLQGGLFVIASIHCWRLIHNLSRYMFEAKPGCQVNDDSGQSENLSLVLPIFDIILSG